MFRHTARSLLAAAVLLLLTEFTAVCHDFGITSEARDCSNFVNTDTGMPTVLQRCQACCGYCRLREDKPFLACTRVSSRKASRGTYETTYETTSRQSAALRVPGCSFLDSRELLAHFQEALLNPRVR